MIPLAQDINAYFEAVEQRLENSIYKGQLNDFYFLTLPEGNPDAGIEAPVDYKLKELVLYFWKHNFITYGWNQGYDDSRDVPYYPRIVDTLVHDNKAFIGFKNKLTTGGDSFTYLKKILIDNFGADNIIELNESCDTESQLKQNDYIIVSQPTKLLLKIGDQVIFLVFNKSFIDEMNCALGLNIIDHNSRYPGYITRTKCGYVGSIKWGK